MIKTTSLETAKLLKEAGFPQEAEYYYVQMLKDGEWHLHFKEHGVVLTHRPLFTIAAPTAEEVIDEIKGKIQIERYKNGDWSIYWMDSTMNEYSKSHIEKDKSFAEAAALLWLYLKAQGLLKGTE